MSNNKKGYEKSRGGVFNSIRTKLSVVMLAGAIIPLIVAVTVSYSHATEKATKDAVGALEWQARYIQSEFDAVVDENLYTIKAVASAPSTIRFMQDPDNQEYRDEALTYLNAIDEGLYDESVTVLTGPDGMQLLADKDILSDVADREYFVQAMNGKTYVSDVMITKATGERNVTFSAPIYADGKVIGIVQRNYNLQNFHDLLAQEAEDAFLVDRKGYVVAHSKYEISPENEDDRSSSKFMTSDLAEGNYTLDTGKGEKAIVCYVRSFKTGFTVVTTTDSKTVSAATAESSIIIIVIGIAMAVCTALIAFSLAKSFTDPIISISRAFSEMASGYLVKIEKYRDRKDEFGQMIRDSNAVLERVGDIAGNIKASAEKIEKNSDQLAEMAQQIAKTTGDISEVSLTAGATPTADSMRELSDAVSVLADNAAGLREISENLNNEMRFFKN